MRLQLRNPGGPLTDSLRRVDHPGIGQVPARLEPDETVDMVCGYCSTGCSLRVHRRDGQAVNLTPTPGYPVNTGSACPKGWEALTPMTAPDRAVMPLLRRNGRMHEVGWPEAVSTFVDRMRTIVERHGPESIAFLSTGQIPTEEMALLGALFKFGMGGLDGDGNTRQCMATSVVAYKEAFGFDAPPYTYADLDQSDVIVLWGSNLAVAHPILWERVVRNPHAPEVIVIDPRVTETSQRATVHAPLAPKSDLVLAYGLAHALIEQGAADEEFVAEHTTGYEEFALHVSRYPRNRVADETGLPASTFDRMVELVARGERVSFWWTMGVNQSHQGTRTAQAIIDLALLTGNIGRPGTGANSVTGQCNAMGSRLFSNTTSLLGGHDFADPEHRVRVAGVLGIDAAWVPTRASLAYDQILDRVATGKIRGLWIIATNTAHSWIGQDDCRDLLGRLEFLCVQDLYADTDTAALADLVLPAAGWGEKEGTFINSERRIGRVRRAMDPPGQARSDFEIFQLIATEWGCSDAVLAFPTPEATFQVLASLTEGRPCDITGISGYDMLEERGGVQWPYPSGGDASYDRPERRLFEDGVFPTPDGRARFVYDEPVPAAEQTSERYPLVLLTGRGTASQWHTGTRTSRSPVLVGAASTRAHVEISPEDAAQAGLVTGDDVFVETARAAVRVVAMVIPTVEPGHLWMSMHHPETNRLTFPEFDPHSRQPSYKHCAAAVRLPHHWE